MKITRRHKAQTGAQFITLNGFPHLKGAQIVQAIGHESREIRRDMLHHGDRWQSIRQAWQKEAFSNQQAAISNQLSDPS